MNFPQNMSSSITTPASGQNQEQNDETKLVALVGGTPMADSRVIAEHCGVNSKNFRELIADHLETMESTFGRVRFETAPSLAVDGRGTGERYALLSEDQATFAITLTRNTEPVIKFKAALVKAFAEAKQRLSTPFSLPKTYSEALRALADTAESNAKLAIENDRLAGERRLLLDENDTMAPKAALCDAAISSRDLLTVNAAAKLLCGGDGALGEKRLFAFLRRERVLRTCLRDDGSPLKEHNTPFQKYLDQKFFEVKEFPFNTRNHGVKISLTTFVTQKGLIYIQGLINRGGKA